MYRFCFQLRLNDIIKYNLKKIVDDAKTPALPVIDEGVTIYYGLQAYDQFLKEIDTFRENYNRFSTVSDRRVFGIKLMVLRRFLLPASGAGDFFRTELAEAFRFYGEYIKNDRFHSVAEQLMKTSTCWLKLAPLLSKLAVKKEKESLLNNLYELVSEIKDNELTTINKLAEAIT